ncbi:hypothetical protein YC2023_019485 [Brassica napus]
MKLASSSSSTLLDAWKVSQSRSVCSLSDMVGPQLVKIDEIDKNQLWKHDLLILAKETFLRRKAWLKLDKFGHIIPFPMSSLIEAKNKGVC